MSSSLVGVVPAKAAAIDLRRSDLREIVLLYEA